MKNIQRGEIVTLEIVKKMVDICSFETRYLINGERINISGSNMFPKDWRYGGFRKSVVFKKIVETIFLNVRINRPINVFLPVRYLSFIQKIVYHRGLRDRLLAKLLTSPSQKKIEYSLDNLNTIPKHFPGFVRSMREPYEITMGYFETSHWRSVQQVSSFGKIHLVRYYEKTVENDSDTWWISRHRRSSVKHRLWIILGDIQKDYSSNCSYDEILDVKYYPPTDRFYIKMERDGEQVWEACFAF